MDATRTSPTEFGQSICGKAFAISRTALNVIATRMPRMTINFRPRIQPSARNRSYAEDQAAKYELIDGVLVAASNSGSEQGADAGGDAHSQGTPKGHTDSGLKQIGAAGPGSNHSKKRQEDQRADGHSGEKPGHRRH